MKDHTTIAGTYQCAAAPFGPLGCKDSALRYRAELTFYVPDYGNPYTADGGMVVATITAMQDSHRTREPALEEAERMRAKFAAYLDANGSRMELDKFAELRKDGFAIFRNRR